VETVKKFLFIAVAAAEVGVGLAMVLLVYRNRKSIALDELSEMKG
jgi:NADH:ubiquinone oxidoreductase subunit K